MLWFNVGLCPRFHTTFVSATDTSSINWICWNIWPNWQRSLYGELILLLSLLLFSALQETCSVFGHSVNESVLQPREGYVSSKFQRGPIKYYTSFLVLGEDWWDLGLIPGFERSPGGGCTNPLQYPCLENLLVGYSPWGHKELDTTEQLSTLKAAGLTWQVLMYCCCWCNTILYTNREIFKCPKHQTSSK